MLIKIHPDNPSQRQILKVVEVLRKGGVIIYPTDTVYGIGCDITQPKAIEKVARIKGISKEKANFSFLCNDLSQLSHYTLPINNDLFKVMKSCFPGPFTFILPANNKVPKIMQSKKKTIGIRVPDHNIAREIVHELGNPILTTSLHDDDIILDYPTDPELIYEKYQNTVDLVIDGGFGGNVPSTIINAIGNEYEVTRQGKGEI